MNIKNIFSALAEHRYNYTKSTNPQYMFFCKDADNCFSAVILIDDIRYKQTTDPLVFTSIRESLEKTFLLRGYRQVNVLFVILTNNPFAYKKFADSDFVFWIADINSCRIISYSADDEHFNSIRDSLEACLCDTKQHDRSLFRSSSGRFKSLPIFTILFALINICVFLYMDNFCNYIELNNIYGKYSLNWQKVFNNGEYYRLFTSMFIHYDFNHLSNNMITLLAIGYMLEPAIGRIKFFATYILSGICGGICSALYYSSMGEPVLSAGASGAIFGIFGAYAVCALFDMLKHRNTSFSRIAFVTLIMLYNGMVNENVDNAAHLGGLIFGCIIAFICCIYKKNDI